MAKQPTNGGVTPIGGSGVKFWTVAEVADTLRVSRMSVYRLIHSGELEAVQFGRSFRVSQEALDAYLKKAFYQTG
ncbi:MAG TPA: helix-turn-helix domain-containing protein [Microlunatus sp.]|jgi:excisionase family DNA binding protein|nr:helix-turn-helix domain-containing protein [Microlunatus sp.]